jgi:hypothetical protein
MHFPLRSVPVMSKIRTQVYFSPEKCYNYRKSAVKHKKMSRTPSWKKNPGYRQIISGNREIISSDWEQDTYAGFKIRFSACGSRFSAPQG